MLKYVAGLCLPIACNAQAIYKCGFGNSHPGGTIGGFMTRQDRESDHNNLISNGQVIDTWTGNLADGSRHPDVSIMIQQGTYFGLNMAAHPNVDLICSRGMPAVVAFAVIT